MTKTVTRVTKRDVSIVHQPRCDACGRMMKSHIEVGGVRLPPIKARIFQLVRDRPNISSREICDEIYETVTERTIGLVRVHVTQMRDMLIGTGVTVRGMPGSGYLVLKEEPVHV